MPEILFLDHAGVMGGAELYLLDVAHAFRSSCRVLLFEEGPFLDALHARGVAAEVTSAPAAFHSVKKQSGFFSTFRAAPGLVELVREVARVAASADVVYANSQKALVTGALAGYIAGRPVIWNLHDILTADHFSATNRRLAVWVANRWVDRVVANSEATQAAFAESGGRLAKTAVVYNGIDHTPFEAVDDAAVRRLRRALGLDEALLMGVFGRLAAWKGQHIMIEALPALPGAHVLFVGDALFRGDHPYARRLHALTRDLGVADRVHFLGFRDDVPRLMKLVDVVVHTSAAPEPFGRVLVEGMLARKPVVATAAGGAREVVHPGETGLLVPPGDPRALAAALQPLMDAPIRRKQMGAAGYRRARTCFSLDRMLHGVHRQIHTVLHQPEPVS